MANIIGRLTNNEVEVLQVDAVPSGGAGTSAPIGAIAMYNNGTVGLLYLKVSALDTGWDQVNTAGVSGGVLTGVAGALSVYPANGNQVDDVLIQNGQNVIVSHVTHPSRSVAITYSIPNPGNAIASAEFVLTEGGQTINGAKTFTGNAIFQGNVSIQGTLTTINSTQLEVSDPTITLNKGGAASSAGGSGIEVEENAVITAFLQVAGARNGWVFKAPTNANTATILLSSLAANRSFTLPDVSGTLPVGTGAAGQVAFWSGNNIVAGDNAHFWDNTNKRLGIGNQAPSVALHVTGAARVTSLNAAQVVRSDVNGNLVNGTIDLASADVINVLPIARGGTNSGTTLSNNRIMVSSGGAIVEATALTNGQLLIGSTGAAPVAANITQGATTQSIVITNGAGSIALDTVQDIRASASPTFVNATLSGKTAGSVLFAATSGVIQQDNATFFWDTTNKRLGLGNATPQRQLDVTGTTIHRGAIRYADAGASAANWEIFQAQVNTTDATATTLQSVTIPTDSTVFLRAKIVGRRTGGSAGANGDSAVYERSARFKNVGGTVTINNLQTDYTAEEPLQQAWNATLDVSGASARMRVTGAANNNITWTVTYEVITLS